MNFGSPILQAWANASRRQPPLAVNDEIVVVTDVDEGSNESTEPNPPSFLVAPNVPLSAGGKRNLQCVSTKYTKIKVLNWMQQEYESRGSMHSLMADTVRHFPEVFRAPSRSANLMKVGRWWTNKEDLLQDFEWDTKSLSNGIVGWRKRVELKARPGRGRKVSPENEWLYPLVRSEFERLRKAGVKFSPGVLLLMAKNVVLTSPHPTFGPSSILGNSGKSLLDRITPRWVQQFSESQGIVHRSQTGKLQLSPEKTVYIERAVAYHLGQLARGFASGELNEDLVENMDETHFIVNMDNGKTLGFRGDSEVKYVDVVSGGIGITMVVKVTGGRAARISTPMLIFQNLQSSYPIRGTPDTVPGVCYRSSPSSFMTSELLSLYYSETRVSWADPGGRTKIQYIDNYPGHNVIPSCTEALARIKTELRYFPANSTHLTQPCDSFVISKIKDAWKERWDSKKMEMIAGGMWQGDGREGTSGALKNPGWSYFLQLVADSVRSVNAAVDKRYGISYARKAMIRCGLSLNLDRQWDVKQLTPELQEIIAKYRGNFEGSLEGLTSGVPGPRPVRQSTAGSGRGRGRAAARNGEGGRARVVGGRGQMRGINSEGANSVAGRQVGESSAVDPGLDASVDVPIVVRPAGLAATTTWVSTRPGARAHRKAARQGNSRKTSTFFSASQSAVAGPTVGESSVGGDAGVMEAHGVLADLPDAQLPESVEVDVVADLNLDSELWGFLETQYNQ